MSTELLLPETRTAAIDDFACRASVYLSRNGLDYDARVAALVDELDVTPAMARTCALTIA